MAAPEDPVSPATPASGNGTDSKKVEKVIAKPKVFSFMKEKTSAHLRWKDINFHIKARKEKLHILKGISGELRTGQLTAIIGPSGSGKTTLLNLLSGRQGDGGNKEVSGEFALNGKTINPKEQNHQFAYVMQDDSLMFTETVRECIMFAAKMRMKNVTQEEREHLVDDMIESLGLSECKDTLIGNEMIKGVSGGQRKRTSIGAELITNPAIAFLDEPTSGLDAATAYNIVGVLKELTRMKRSVLCTIHQPSSEIFHMFDSAIFIVKGMIIYHGPPSGIREHFEQLNYEVPADYNPADFVMFLAETADEATLSALADAWQKRAAAVVTVSGTWVDDEVPPKDKGNPMPLQIKMLIGRQWRNLRRDKASLGGRFGITIILNGIFAFVFWGVGDRDDSDYTLQAHMGAMTMIGINSMFGSTQPALLVFPSERPVFLREAAAQLYSVVPYFISKSLVEIALIFLQCIVIFLITYWSMGFQGQFFEMVLSSFLIGSVSASIGLMIGSMVANVKTALEIVPMLFVPQILFAGFFIKMEQITVVLRWIEYLCPLKWGMNMMFVAEFRDVPGTDNFFSSNDIEKDDQLIYLIVLVSLLVLFRVMAMVILTKKAKTLYD